jgi:hypothetical protein
VAFYSEQFDNAAWNKIDSSVTANTTISPDGFTNADTIAFTASANSRCEIGLSGVFESQSHTVSVYAKVASGTGTFRLKCTHSSIDDYYSSDLTATTQWQRFTFTQAFSASVGSGINFGIINGTNALAKNVIFYGFQTEINASYATSYIPTLGSSVTRLADVASKTGISSLIGQTAGTLYVEAEYTRENVGAIARKIISLNDGSSANLIDIFVPSGLNTLNARIRANSTTIGEITISNTPTGKIKIAYAYKENDYALYINGTQFGTVTSGGAIAFSAAVSIAQVGDGEAATDELGGRVSAAAIYTTRLSNAELQSLTSL